MKKSKGEQIFNIINNFLLTLLMLVTVYPFIYTLSLSLSSAAAASVPGLHLYPKEISTMAYSMVFNYSGFFIAYGNTLFRTIVGTAMALIVTLLYAYSLSRKELPCRKLFTVLLLFSMLFVGGQIPKYLALKSLGLINSRWVYVFPYLIVPYNVIVAKEFFKSLPESLNESARIDGAGEFRILFSIIIPLSKAIVMTLMLWIAVFHWNTWYDSVMYINDSNKIVVQALLQYIVKGNNYGDVIATQVNPDTFDYTPETVKSATIMVAILPILMLYPFIQKHFVKGIMLGAIKE